MGKIRRDWLKRIPDYDWVESDRPHRRKRRPGKKQGEAGDPLWNGEDGEPGSDPDGDPGSGPENSGRVGAEEGAAEAGQEGEAPEDQFSLHVPEDVEERRKEEQEKRRRTGLNRGLAPQAFALEGHYLRNLAARFARMVSKVAEDSADMPSQGDEEWDLPELLRRRFTGRLINQCRMTREKRKVAVVLDTSPSCEHQARLFGSIAHIAEALGDCDLYDAPNFAIMAHKSGSEWETLPDAEREWSFRGRVVLAFGDFDGIDRICAASAVRGNKIYWFCCEERPSVLESGRETFVHRFKGHYLPATTLPQLMHAMRKVR